MNRLGSTCPHLPLWTLLLVALLAAAQLWGPGIVNTRGGGDSPFLLQRTHQMAENLRAGVFPVRWMPDMAYGLGFPFFNHYSAFPFYLAAGLGLMGLDILSAIKLTQTLGFIFAALAMYGWIFHLWKSRPAAWLAAVAYTVAPFHVVNVYVRGDSLSEFYAFVWYPLILWAVDRVIEKPSQGWRLALPYAGLVLSHNISAFIFSPFVVLYLLFKMRRTRRVRNALFALAGLLIGMALSAWAWLPALLEQNYVQPETLTLGYFNYANHFRSTNLVQPNLPFDYSIAVTPDGPSPFAMGGPQAALALAGLLIASWLIFENRPRTKDLSGRQKASREASSVIRPSSFVYLVASLLLSTLMITPLSRLLWKHVPLLEVVQFPWRFLSVQSLFAAAVTAAWITRLKGRWAWGVAGGIAVLLVGSTLWPLRPDRLLVGPDDVTVTRLQEYELFTGNLGTTIRWEWLPRETTPRPFTSDAVVAPDAPPRPFVLEGALVDAAQTRSAAAQTWRVTTGPDGAALAFPLLYWPGWRATVDGASTPVWAVESAGYLALNVPPGQHTVRLVLGRTPLRAGAETVSFVTLLLLIGWIGMRVPVRRVPQTVTRKHAMRCVLYIAPVLTILLIFAARSASPPDRIDDLTMDFVDQPYLHHNPDGVDLGAARLLSYDLSADLLAPGDTLTVTLHWDQSPIPLRFASGTHLPWRAVPGIAPNPKPRAVLRLVSPAEHLPDLDAGPLPIAQDEKPLTETTVHSLHLPENTPRGLYLIQIQIKDSDHAPLYLRPVRVTKGAPLPTGAPVLAFVGPDIRLHAATLHTQDGYLVAQVEWSTVRQIAANFQVSVRLLDPDGNLRAQLDTQPGYGFAPTSLWRPGERVGDRFNLPLPDDLPPGDGYRLTFIYYRMPTTAEVARVTLPPFAWPPNGPIAFEPPPRLFQLPAQRHPLDIDFGGQVRLAGYELITENTALDLTLWWQALGQPPVDYTVFVHLFDADTNLNATQSDAMPRGGSYPTTAWLPGQVISETVRLSLADVPPGDYRLAVGLYDASTGVRLRATAPGGAPVPDDRLVVPETVEVPGQ